VEEIVPAEAGDQAVQVGDRDLGADALEAVDAADDQRPGRVQPAEAAAPTTSSAGAVRSATPRRTAWIG
jgi:hypothetical protein